MYDLIPPRTRWMHLVYITQERHHAMKAGVYGDDMFKSQVIIRPLILLNILKQGYPLLWTDSDMVWFGNPLPLLPKITDSSAVRPLQFFSGPFCSSHNYQNRSTNVSYRVLSEGSGYADFLCGL